MPKRILRPWWILVSIVILLSNCASSCKKETTIVVPDSQLTVPGEYLAELEAVAIGPGDPKCANGRAIIASWNRLFSLDLSTFVATDITSKLPTPTPETSPGELYEIGGDPQLARHQDGSFLFLRQGSTTAPISGPQPEWVTAHTNRRSMLFIWRSTNCGNTWEVFHPIDSQNFLGGECAYPQSATWFGGFDRNELYTDPWNGNIYLTSSCRSGYSAFPGHGRQVNLLFVLRPGDSDWRAPVELPWNAPLVMTSNKSGLLWLYHWLWNKPPPGQPETFQSTVYTSDTQGETINNPTGLPVVYDTTAFLDPINEVSLPTSNMFAANQKVNAANYAIGRSGDADQILLAYPVPENGRHVLKTAILTNVPLKITVKPGVTFRAEEADASILQPTLIESDRVGINDGPRPALLYWLESSPGSGKIQVRYSIATNNLNWSEPKTISTAAWTPNFDSGAWGGDYVNGAYYFDNGKSHFLLTWSQSESGISHPNLNIHYAVVSAEP